MIYNILGKIQWDRSENAVAWPRGISFISCSLFSSRAGPIPLIPSCSVYHRSLIKLAHLFFSNRFLHMLDRVDYLECWCLHAFFRHFVMELAFGYAQWISPHPLVHTPAFAFTRELREAQILPKDTKIRGQKFLRRFLWHFSRAIGWSFLPKKPGCQFGGMWAKKQSGWEEKKKEIKAMERKAKQSDPGTQHSKRQVSDRIILENTSPPCNAFAKIHLSLQTSRPLFNLPGQRGFSWAYNICRRTFLCQSVILCSILEA